MSDAPALIVRLTPYTDDPFGLPPPPVVESTPRLWTIVAAIPVALLLTAITSSFCLIGVYLPIFSQVRAMRLGLAEARAALTAQPAGYFASGLGVCFALAAVALVAAVFSPTRGLRERLRLTETPRWFLNGLMAGVAALGVGEVMTGARAFAGVNGGGPLGVMRHDFGAVGPELTLLGVVVVAFGAGIGEELFFRGYLQTRLEERIPAWASNLMVGILFGVAHGELWHSTFAFGAGVVFGWTARRSGSVLPAITAHVLNNAVRVLQSSLAASTAASWYHDRGASHAALGAAMIAAGIGGVYVSTRRP